MSGNLSLGNKKGKLGNFDINNIRAGIKKDDLLKGVDPKMKSVFEQIFAQIDTEHKDDTLSRAELEKFFKVLTDLADKKGKGDTTLSKGEAKKFEIDDPEKPGETKQLGRKGKDALFALLNRLTELSKDVKVTPNPDGSETNEYPDGTIEQVFSDGKIIRTEKKDDKTTVETTTENGKETERKETRVDDDATRTTYYTSGKKTKQVANFKEGYTSEITFDEKEEPSTLLVNQDGVKSEYKYNKAFPHSWQPVKTTKTVNNETVETKFKYYKNGDTEELESTLRRGEENPYKTVRKRYDKEHNLKQEEIVENGNTRTREYNPDHSYTENYVEDGFDVTDEYNSAKVRTSQTRIKSGQLYEVKYDENGNTTGVIVQNGESVQDIVNRFGVEDKEALLKANRHLLKGRHKFNPGDEIVIPGRMSADKYCKAQEGRKDAEGARAEYRAEQARIAEERRRQAEVRRQREEARINQECAELGMTSVEGAGDKIQGHYIKSPNEKQEYTVIGKCKYGTIAKDSKGNIVVIRSDGVIADKNFIKNKTKAANAQMNAAKSGTGKGDTVVYNGKVYTIVDDKANAKGQIKVKGEDGKEIWMSKSFVEASKNLAKGQVKFSLTNPKIRYAKDSVGKVWYFDENGNVIDGTKKSEMFKAEAKLISDKLIKATDRWGTDEELLLKGVQQIYCPEILDQINATLKSKGYKDDTLTKPIEDLFLSELSRSESRSYIKALASAGGYGVGAARDKAMGRNCAREIDWELHGGTGYTGSKDLKEALGMADTRAARLETERIVGAKQTQCGKVKATEPDHGSWVRAYVAEDGWKAIEVDIFDMVWMKNKAYTHEEDQEHRNGLIERAMTADKTDASKAQAREARNTAYDAMEAGTEDETHAREVAKRENAERGYEAQHEGQDELQTFIAGSNKDENGNVDAAQVSASNTNLYKGAKPPEVQAQEILNYVAQGDYSHLFDSMEPEVYEKLNELTGNPNYVKEMYTELMKTASGGDKMKIMSNAILSKQIEFSKQELIDFCIELMHSIDDYYGSGASSGQSAKAINIAAYMTTQLKAILSQHPEILQEVKARVEEETFVSTSRINVSSSQYGQIATSSVKEDRKGIYQQILNSTYTVDSLSVFLDDNGNEITNSEIINYIIQAQKDSLEELRKYVAELEREFNKTVDSEGDVLAGTANYLSERSGIGTDRDDVRTAYRQAKQWLNQLEAAAEGKLRDSSGKNVSFDELAQKIMEKVEKLNTDYNTTISYGKMAAVMGPVLLVTIPVSMGAAALTGAAVTAGTLSAASANLIIATTAGAAAGGTTYALNYAEMATSVTGDTMEARERNYLESSIAAFSTAIGAGQMKYICSMFNNASAITRFGGRLSTVLASDVGVAGVGEYIQSGTVTVEGMSMTLLFSMTGNLIGIKSLTMKDIPNVTPPKPHADSAPDVLDVATSHGTRNASDVHVGTKPNQRTGAAPKSEQIKKLVDDYIAEGQMTPKRTSEMREQLEQIANPDVREQSIRKLDAAAERQMSAEDYAAYKRKVEADVRKYADDVLKGTEAINPSDARRVRESFEYRTPEELEKIIKDLEPRQGRYQQGVDQAAQLIKEAKAALRQKNAVNADLASLMGDLDACIGNGRGLNENVSAKLKEVLPKLTDDADIQAFLAKWKQIKKPSASDKSFVRKILESKGYIKDPNGNFVKNGASEPASTAPKIETETPNARRFTEAEIKDFTDINAKNIKELEEKLKSLGFEREMIGNNGIVMSPMGDDILFSFINKNKGVRYVFKAGDNKVIPHRMIQTDTKTGKIHNSVEIQRDADGNIIGTIEKNADNASTPHAEAGERAETPRTTASEAEAKPVTEAELAGKTFASEAELDAVMSGYEKTIVGDGSKRKIVYFNESGEKFEFVKTTDGKLKLNSEAPETAAPKTEQRVSMSDEEPKFEGTNYSELSEEELYTKLYKLFDEPVYDQINEKWILTPENLAIYNELRTEFNARGIKFNDYIEAMNRPHSATASTPRERAANAKAEKAAQELNSKVDNCFKNNFENIEELSSLTPAERKLLAEAYDDNPKTLLMFLKGEKPSAYVSASDEVSAILHKLKSSNIEILRTENCVIMFNKDQVKHIITENKELFAKRLGLSEKAGIDEIYSKLIGNDGLLGTSPKHDILGMVLGYPKTSTMIFELEQLIPNFNSAMRYDIPRFKKQLVEALYSENSPYKNMSPEFKVELEHKINSMTDIREAADVLGGFEEYPFVYYVDEPSEIARIRDNIERTAQKLDDIPSSKPHADGGTAPQAKSYAEMNDEELFAEYFSLRNEVEYSPLSNADKAARIKKMNEITRLLEEQGFEVRMENGQPIKVKKGANKGVNEGGHARPSEESRFFSQKDIDNYVADFADIQNNPYAVYAELEKRGFREIGGHTMEYRGDEFINMFNPKSGEICTFIYKNGKLLSKNKALATRNADGTFTRHSDLSIRYDESGKPHVKVDDHSNNIHSARKPEGLSEHYVRTKYGAKMAKAWNDAIDFIKRVVSKETYASAAAWIKSKFPRTSELFSDLMTRLERRWAKVKPADSYTGSKAFDRKALDDFVNEPMNKSVMNIFDETHAKGFERLDENGKPYPKDVVIGMGNPDTYTGIMSFLDPKTGMKYTYGFDHGIMVARERISPNGETMFYATDGRTGKPLVIIRSEEGIVFDKSFTEIKSSQYQTGMTSDGDRWYTVKNANEIPDAIGVHLELFPKEVQEEIVAALRSGRNYSINMHGKTIEFSIKNNNIQVRGGFIEPARARAYKNAYKNYNPNQQSVKLENGILNQNAQYLLDINNPPKLTLIDGTVVDLNSYPIREMISNLKPGEYLTLGREGMIEVSKDMSVSGQHILITRGNDGRFVLKDISRNGNTRVSVNSRASQGAGNAEHSNARGRINETYYEIGNRSEYKQKMADKLNLFSENTQQNIISSLERMGYIRLQKRGVEYIFVKRNGKVQLQEFDIKQKYNVTETKISDTETRTTYETESPDDIWWALDGFDSQTRNFIATNLKEGRGCKFDTSDAKYYVSMDANGKITVQKKIKVIEPEEPSSANASRADDAAKSNGRKNITPEQQQLLNELNEMIQAKKSEISGYEQWIATVQQKMDDASKLTQAKISEYKSILGIPENVELTKDAIKKALRKKSIEFHPDRYQGADADVKMREVNEANEALNDYLDQSKFRQDIDNYNAEIAKLNKDIADIEESIRKITG